MSIFSAIKDAIFGHANATASNNTPPPPKPPVSPQTAKPATTPQAAKPATAQAPAPKEVDVEAILSKLNADSEQKLNWRSSIVDLMKLLKLDSSLSQREALAKELGYTGKLDGSAEMNIWLHKRVMQELAANGGKVPAKLIG